jgi:thiosulfate/3-mercaptopyruvate sulfurtransferase
MLRLVSTRVLPACLAVLILAIPAHAQSVREEMLVSPDWLQRRLGTVTLLHAGDAAGYAAGHIPGAVLLEMPALLVDLDGTPNELPSVAALESVFRAAGVGVRDRIVVYSNDPVLAARAWFTLDYLGQGTRTAMLNGGLARWMAAGYAISTDRVLPKRGAFVARTMPQAVVRLAAFREVMRLRQELGTKLVLIDARSSEQFCGEETGAGVDRPGHIPGAVNIPFTENFDPGGAVKSVYELRQLYHRAGIRRDTANIVYCRTGMQAAMTYFVLRYLGYGASLYDGSYVEWSGAGGMVWS